MATSSTYYIDTNDFSTATAVWINAGLTTKAPDGYYSFGGNYRRQFNGLLQPVQSCESPITSYPFMFSNTGEPDPSGPSVACSGFTNIMYYSNSPSLYIGAYIYIEQNLSINLAGSNFWWLAQGGVVCKINDNGEIVDIQNCP